MLAGALGVGVGGVASFAALFFGGSVVGLSAAGITSGLAAAGAVVGGGMAAGVAVLSAPAVVLGAAGVGIAANVKNKKLKDAKELCYKNAVKAQSEIIKALRDESKADKERMDYLNALNICISSPAPKGNLHTAGRRHPVSRSLPQGSPAAVRDASGGWPQCLPPPPRGYAAHP